jgi:glycosyltransferase involved in cell wall biosynthesis
MDSILGQTFTDFEFIVIDDGSTDGSGEILEDYARRDDRIRILRQENAGVAAALNTGIAASLGRYVARMDSDDISLPERFALQVEYLDSHPECGLVGAFAELIDEDGEAYGVQTPALTHESIDQALLGLGPSAGKPLHNVVTMRALALEQIGPYDTKRAWVEDWDLFLRLAEHWTMHTIPEVQVRYRAHVSQATTEHALVIANNAQEILDEAVMRRGLPERIILPGHPQANRASTIRQRRAGFHSYIGWRALALDKRKMARNHARRALRATPLGAKAWRLASNAYLPKTVMDGFRKIIALLR